MNNINSGCASVQECISRNIQTGCCMARIARHGQGPITPPVLKDPGLPKIIIPEFFPQNTTAPSLSSSVFTSLNQALESVAGEDSMAKAGVAIATIVLTAAVVFGVVKGVQYFQKKVEPKENITKPVETNTVALNNSAPLQSDSQSSTGTIRISKIEAVEDRYAF